MAQTIYTPTQLSTMLDALVLRMNLVDGQNLPAHTSGPCPRPSGTGDIQQLQAGIAGLKKTLGQVNLGAQQQIAALAQQIAALSALVAGLAGTGS